MWVKISEKITEVTGQFFTMEKKQSVSGGCINQGYCISNSEKNYFVKINQAYFLEMFIAEYHGLNAIKNTNTIKVPHPLCYGIADHYSYLVMEYLDLGGSSSKGWEKMGQDLATLHLSGGVDRFGWERNNTIGSTPQINSWTENWADFFAEFRIGYQLRLAQKKGGNFPHYNIVIPAVKALLKDHHPQPSLLHGDLWSGNAAITREGDPVIVDPAVYYGDRETDLAMTELFGGFPSAFYQGYQQIAPLDRRYQQRKTLYNLYHILNHFNLFGGGYESQAKRMIEDIIQ